MHLDSAEKDQMNQHRLAQLEKIVQEKPDDPERIRIYQNHAVATNQIGRARKIFDALQTQFPNDQHIRSLNIALRLKNQDYAATRHATIPWSRPKAIGY